MHVTLTHPRDVDTVVSSHQEYMRSRNCDLNLMVRAAQASPDHGFCGVSATGLVTLLA